MVDILGRVTGRASKQPATEADLVHPERQVDIAPVRQHIIEDRGYYERADRESISQRRETIMQLFARGIMPPLSNGYSFVVDRRPEGNEDDPIHCRDYTTYFSNRQVPMADQGHKLHYHDVTHVEGYKRMFANARFADVAQRTATIALASEGDELCGQFTNAINGFGDNLGDLMQSLDEQHATYIEDAQSARYNLGRLIELLPSDEYSEADREHLFDGLWQELGLASYEKYAVYKPRDDRNVYEYTLGMRALAAAADDEHQYPQIQLDPAVLEGYDFSALLAQLKQ